MQSKFENNMGDTQWLFTDSHLEVTEVRMRTRRQIIVPYSSILYFSSVTNREDNNGDSTFSICLRNGQEFEMNFGVSSFRADDVEQVKKILMDKVLPAQMPQLTA